MQDLGEEKLPEPASSASSSTSEAPDSEKEASISTAPQEPTESPIEPDTSTTLPEGTPPPRPVTTERKPMHIPASVHVRITPENLKDYVGPPVYQKDRMYAYMPPPGVSTGLGYLGNGSGAVMPIEAMVRRSASFSEPSFVVLFNLFCIFVLYLQSMPGKGGLQLTGKLGEVIRESAQIAQSWVRSHAFELGITKAQEEQFLVDRDIHVHMPEGSIGKEGPSAGTAILTAFVSLFTKTRVSQDIGMCFFLERDYLWCSVADYPCYSDDGRDFPRWPGSPCWRVEGEDPGSPSSRDQDDHCPCCQPGGHRGECA